MNTSEEIACTKSKIRYSCFKFIVANINLGPHN